MRRNICHVTTILSDRYSSVKYRISIWPTIRPQRVYEANVQYSPNNNKYGVNNEMMLIIRISLILLLLSFENSYYRWSICSKPVASRKYATCFEQMGHIVLLYCFCCRIRVKSLNEKSDLKALAQEIIDKCSLIHQSKILEVEQLLYFLQNRKEFAGNKCW